MQERWVEIPEFPCYKVSNLGRVISEYYEGFPKLMNPWNSNGYRRVELRNRNSNKSYNKLVHRLVAEAFIPNPLGYTEVNHIDEDKSNNQVSNLEWCSRKYNINYGTGMARAAAKKSHKVLAKSADGAILHRFNSTKEAARYGFDSGTISKCCNGFRKSHKGLYWEYV